MNENLLLNNNEVLRYVDADDYSGAAKYLFERQLNEWDLLKNNSDKLREAESKSFWFEGYKIKVLHIPHRVSSTSANTDAEFIKKRSCFLCAANLPIQQRGISINKNFILLCNPYPIFPMHFTITSAQHIPQNLWGKINELVTITKLMTGFTLLYNSANCGASAPDHFHYQAGTKTTLPVEDDVQQLKNEYGTILTEREDCTVTAVDDLLRKFVVIESSEKKIVEIIIESIYKALQSFGNIQDEPMFNIISNFSDEFGWQVTIFLRSRHRPQHYFKEGSEKLLVSPAAADLGGMIITPRLEDFEKINEKLIREIYNDVVMDENTFSKIKTAIQKSVVNLF